jgi:hypothetical protein
MRLDETNGSGRRPGARLGVLLVAGSTRSFERAGAGSKARALVQRMAGRLPTEWEIDVEDLGNAPGRARIQACNGCASTSMALCCWPCNCYRPDDPREPDLFWDLDLYARLERADAWAIVGPVHWNAPTSSLKLMFDRLVCMSGGNPRPDLIDGKDPAKARALERTPLWKELSANHLEGRSAAFFCYGDEGGDDLDESGRPRILRHREWLDPKLDLYGDTRLTYAPLVQQCRYCGIEVPDELWRYAAIRRRRAPGGDPSEHLAGEPSVLDAFDRWTDSFARHVSAKGKVEPGRFPASRPALTAASRTRPSSRP